MIPGVLSSQQRRRLVSQQDLTIVLDFKNEVYTVFGTSVVFDDLLDGSTNFGDAGDQSFVGIVSPGVGLIPDGSIEGNFIGQALAVISAGCSILVDIASGPSNMIFWRYEEPDFNSGNWAQGYISGTSDIGDFTQSVNHSENFVAGANKMAMTLSDSLLALSINGASDTELNNPVAATALNAAALSASGASTVIEKITIYQDIQPVLSALSAI